MRDPNNQTIESPEKDNSFTSKNEISLKKVNVNLDKANKPGLTAFNDD